MGKKLIIKGADFSTNAINTPLNPVNITELITTFVNGINGIKGTSSNNRKAVYPRFSIEYYRQLGYPSIAVNVKSLGCYPFITSLVTGDVSDQELKLIFTDTAGYIQQKGVYTLNLDDIDPNQSFIYFGLNIDKTLADVSSDNLSDYIEITMLPL